MGLRTFMIMGMAVAVMVAPSGRWLTIRQLSERLQVPVKTLRFWRSRGFGPPGTKFGDGKSALLRYWIPGVEAWEQAEREASEREARRVAS
jgi:hypothetical protein